MYQTYKDRGFTVLSVETTDRRELAQEFVQTVGATFPMVSDDTRSVGAEFGVRFTPTNIMVDRTGRVFFTNIGYSPGREATYAAQIEYLLNR